MVDECDRHPEGVTMNQKRTPAGVPTGGEFAGNEHDEAAGALGTEKNTLWDGGFDRLGAGDTVLVPLETLVEHEGVQNGEVYRDYDGDIYLVTTRKEPLLGNPELASWAREHEDLYDDMLRDSYQTHRESRSGRLVTDNKLNDMDEDDEAEVIRRGFLSDTEHHLSRRIADGSFVADVEELRERNTIDVSDAPRTSPEDTAREIKDYYDGKVSEINSGTARAIAADVSRRSTAVFPKLDEFSRTGKCQRDEIMKECNRAIGSGRTEVSLQVLEGWITYGQGRTL